MGKKQRLQQNRYHHHSLANRSLLVQVCNFRPHERKNAMNNGENCFVTFGNILSIRLKTPKRNYCQSTTDQNQSLLPSNTTPPPQRNEFFRKMPDNTTFQKISQMRNYDVFDMKYDYVR